LKTAVLGLASGLLLALAFPPHDWTVLLPLAPVPWLAALAMERRRSRALLSGALFGIAFWCASIPWISYVVTRYGGQSSLMGVVCVFLLSLILCQWPAAVAWATVAVAEAGSWKRLAVFPLLWMASEHARSIVYGGFPWNLTGWPLARHPLWIQSASLWGVYGVGFLVAAVTALLAAFAVSRRAWALAAAAALVLVMGGFGAARLSRLPDENGLVIPVRVALVQPNLHEEDRRTLEGAAARYAAAIEMGREAGRRGVDLLVYPESTFPAYWDRSPRLREDLTALAKECRCAVLFNDLTEGPGDRVSNSARVVTPEGLVETTYRKVHLVPFGEYVPLPKLFFFARRVSSEIGEFTPADSPVVLRAGRLSLGIGICYEILYPELARRQTADGANLLATISNDSWYGKAGAQEQHFAGAAFRAVENGRYLIRAAITGISGIVDDRGRVSGMLPAETAGVVYGTVAVETTRTTAWTAWGHWLPVAADAGALAVLLSGLLRLRRRSQTA
jgi:apolipoprotein N-acyltransferase